MSSIPVKLSSKSEVLIVQESPMHPQSVVDQFIELFEKPSIHHVVGKDYLRSLNSPPIYDDRYLLLFESLDTFKNNIPYLHLEFMQPLVVCSGKRMREDVVALCKDKDLRFKVYVNSFEKADAYIMINELASERVSQSFCDALIRRVGLNPQRIVSAVMVLEQVGYKTSHITKYIDKYSYIDVTDVIESLLHICRSRAQVKRAAMYLHVNRLWYAKHTKSVILKELDTIIKVYRDFLDGTLTNYNTSDYAEANHISRSRVVYISNLLEQKTLVELLALRQFVSSASIMEVALRLT